MTENVDSRLANFEAETLARGQFMPVLRFTLIDDRQRRFQTERMYYLGSIDNWTVLGFDRPIEKLARSLIPALGSEEFFELF